MLAQPQRLQTWRASGERLQIEALAAQAVYIAANPDPERFEIHCTSRGRVRRDLFQANLEHARRAAPQLLRDLVVPNGDLDQSDVQLPQFGGNAIDSSFQDLVRLEVVASVERSRRFN